MSNFNLKLEGLDQLRSKLEKMANADEIKTSALENSGEHLRQEISNSVPVLTGALKEAIIKDEIKDGKILVGPSQQGPAFRAHFVEFGTSKMPARPFMRPAFERAKGEIERIMAKEIRKGLKL